MAPKDEELRDLLERGFDRLAGDIKETRDDIGEHEKKDDEREQRAQDRHAALMREHGETAARLTHLEQRVAGHDATLADTGKHALLEAKSQLSEAKTEARAERADAKVDWRDRRNVALVVLGIVAGLAGAFYGGHAHASHSTEQHSEH